MKVHTPKPFNLKLQSVVRLTFLRVQQERLFTVAGSLAYTTILSIIPALAVSFAMFQAFGGLEKLYATIEPFVLDHLAEGSSGEVVAQIRTFISNVRTTTIGVGGFVGLIFTSMSMLNSFEQAINNVWQVPMKRSLFSRISSYWLFITLGPLALSVALGVAQSQNIPFSNLLPGGTGIFLFNWLLFFGIYKFVPNTKVHSLSALTASAYSAIIFAIARNLYAIYTARFVSYHKIYGSLGAIPILLLWIYIVWIVILSGAALSSVVQTQGFDSKHRPASQP